MWHIPSEKNQLCNLTTCSNKTSEAMGKHTYTQQVASHHLHMKTISHTKGNKQKLENPARFSSIHKAENKWWLYDGCNLYSVAYLDIPSMWVLASILKSSCGCFCYLLTTRQGLLAVVFLLIYLFFFFFNLTGYM